MIGVTTQVGSQAVDRATALLTLVVEPGAPRTFISLVAELGLAKSTMSRLLQALERSRLVQRDQAWAFRPGALLSLYAARPSALHDLAELARPTLQRLGELTEETVNLAVPRGSELVDIAQVESRYLLAATNWVGVDVPAHCAALGKVPFAYGVLPQPLGNLERRTAHCPVDRAQLEHALVEVRRRGWAASLDELEVGPAAVTAPIRAADGVVVVVSAVSGLRADQRPRHHRAQRDHRRRGPRPLDAARPPRRNRPGREARRGVSAVPATRSTSQGGRA